MNVWFQSRLAAWGAQLDALPRPAYAAAAVLAPLLLSLFFFSPKLQLWHLSDANHYETARARSFIGQVEEPLRGDIEPAMRWRLLPPLVARGLGLYGAPALLIPWAGIVVLLGTCTFLLRREGLGRLPALLGTGIAATSSAVLVPTGWLGLNDAWVWAGLAGAALGRGRISLVLLTLVMPWVDERYLIGLPLALAVRCQLVGGTRTPWGGTVAAAAAAVLPYAILRLVLQRSLGWDAGQDFIRSTLASGAAWLPFAPLGWWMAWRAGWVPLASALAGPGGWRTGLLALGTLAAMAVLTVDLSRSAAILLPLMLAGCCRLAGPDPVAGERRLALIFGLNLLLPAAHVVRTTTDLISPLGLELFRLFRHRNGGGA